MRGPLARSVGGLIPEVLARLGLAGDFAKWRAVGEWESIVGESLARSSKATRVQGSTLIVETVDPFRLSHYKTGILDLIHEHTGSDAIQNIRFEHARNPEARP